MLLVLPPACGAMVNGVCAAVPERLTNWGEVPALSVIHKVADTVPAYIGVKTTLMTQDCPTLSVEPQVFVCAKLPAPEPLSVMPTTDRLASPVLYKVIACAVDDVPTACDVKVSEVSERAAIGTSTPVPVRGITASGMDALD